jgi:hypothetical protein
MPELFLDDSMSGMTICGWHLVAVDTGTRYVNECKRNSDRGAAVGGKPCVHLRPLRIFLLKFK